MIPYYFRSPIHIVFSKLWVASIHILVEILDNLCKFYKFYIPSTDPWRDLLNGAHLCFILFYSWIPPHSIFWYYFWRMAVPHVITNHTNSFIYNIFYVGGQSRNLRPILHQPSIDLSLNNKNHDLIFHFKSILCFIGE